jgi:hypothetical protein
VLAVGIDLDVAMAIFNGSLNPLFEYPGFDPNPVFSA